MRSLGYGAAFCLTGALLLSACSSTKAPSHPGSSTSGTAHGGGYYLDDGPADNIPIDLARLPDAVPRVEPYASGPNKPYTVFGHEYVPDTSDRPFVERGIGSWYGRKFNGQKTSSGEIYDMFAMTAAHPTLPIPSYARVTNPANGRSVIVRINDRGPFHPGRVIDLSYAAAYKLGYIGSGSAPVEVERILPADIRAGRIPLAPVAPEAAPLEAQASRVPLPVAAANAPAAVPLPAAPLELAAAAAPAPGPLAQSAAASGASRPANLYDQLPPDLVPEVSVNGRAVVEAPEVTRVVAQASGEAFVQLAAFRVRTGADDFVAHMSGELEPALAQRLRVVAAGSIYRVQIGPYAGRDEAVSAAQRLRDDLGISTMVVAPH